MAIWTRFLNRLFNKRQRMPAKLGAGRRPRRVRLGLELELLEDRVVPAAGTLALASNVLTLTDAGAPTITVAFASNNYSITDTNGLSGSIAGWTISGNSATETDGLGASITKLAFSTTGATFGTSATGVSTTTANIAITDAGSATIGGAITTTSGTIGIAASGAIADNAAIGNASTTGTITISADTAGTGTAGFSMGTSASITTTNATTSALSITVNTTSGGTGNASLGPIAVATSTSSAGTITVNSHGGSILNDTAATLTAQQQGTAGNGGSAPSQVISAVNYAFTATGSGSIGATATPIEVTNFGSSDASGGSNFSLSGGSGGVFVTKWGTEDMTVTGASATGAGSLRIVTGNATGDNLFITGNISAATGNIYLAADDKLEVTGSTIIGGASFSGTVWMQGDRHLSTTGQQTSFASTASIQTSNTTN